MSGGFNQKYRPAALSKVIGNKEAVEELSAYIAKESWPSAILFTGPPGSGKTTLARALIADTNGSLTGYEEANFGAERSKEHIEELCKVARLRPAPGSKRRFILCDEAHAILGAPASADAILKPLEEPVKSTSWLLCSMEPDKFQSGKKGPAIARRCVQISLKLPSAEEKTVFIKRIARQEGFLDTLDKDSIAKIAEACESHSIVANVMESIASRKGSFDASKLDSILSTNVNGDDELAAKFLAALYEMKYAIAHRTVLDVEDGFGFINKCLWLNWFLLSQRVLKGEKHPKVWGSKHGWALLKKSDEIFGDLNSGQITTVLSNTHSALTQLKFGAGAFAVDERMAIAAAAWNMIVARKAKP